MGHMDMGLSPEDGASIPQSLTDGFGLFVGHMTALHLPPFPALLYFSTKNSPYDAVAGRSPINIVIMHYLCRIGWNL